MIQQYPFFLLFNYIWYHIWVKILHLLWEIWEAFTAYFLRPDIKHIIIILKKNWDKLTLSLELWHHLESGTSHNLPSFQNLYSLLNDTKYSLETSHGKHLYNSNCVHGPVHIDIHRQHISCNFPTAFQTYNAVSHNLTSLQTCSKQLTENPIRNHKHLINQSIKVNWLPLSQQCAVITWTNARCLQTSHCCASCL